MSTNICHAAILVLSVKAHTNLKTQAVSNLTVWRVDSEPLRCRLGLFIGSAGRSPLVHPRPLVTTRPVSQHKISDTISQGNFGASMCQDVVNLACAQVRQQSQALRMILPFSRKSLFLPGQVVVGFIRQFPAMDAIMMLAVRPSR